MKHIHITSRQIGANINRLRRESCYTRLDLANALGISDSRLRRIESGETSVTAGTLWDMAVIMETDIGEFFHNLPDSTRPGRLRIPAELVRNWNRSDGIGRNFIEAAARFAAANRRHEADE